MGMSQSLCESHDHRLGRVEDAISRLAAMEVDLKHLRDGMARLETKVDGIAVTQADAIARLAKVEAAERSQAQMLKKVRKTAWGAIGAVVAALFALGQEWLRRKIGL